MESYSLNMKQTPCCKSMIALHLRPALNAAVLDTGERSLGAAGCDAARSAYDSYDAHADCPPTQRSVANDPAHQVAFHTTPCDVWLPPRACAAPIPPNYEPPGGEQRSAHRDQRRLFAPSAGAVDWARYPDYPQKLKPEWGAAGLRGPGGAGKTDCYKLGCT